MTHSSHGEVDEAELKDCMVASPMKAAPVPAAAVPTASQQEVEYDKYLSNNAPPQGIPTSFPAQLS